MLRRMIRGRIITRPFLGLAPAFVVADALRASL
jgi:hypothetical protein